MPRAGWLLLVALAGCQSVAAEKPAADRAAADRFGPTPARVELTPARTAVPAGKDLLLVASVFDAAGDPRRNRRVEWSLTGPGEIVAVAEGAWLPGRSRTIDRTHAVSYTALSDQPAKRGDGATAAVKAGQAWCRVRGGDAETVVTATVPDIPDPARRAATARLNPEPGSRNPEPKPDDPGADDRPPREPSPEPDVSDEPPARPAGRRSESRALRSELALEVSAPPGVGVGQTARVVLSAANRGRGAAAGVSLMARLPAGLELVSCDPPPAVRQGPDEKDLRWGLGDLAAGRSAEAVTLTVKAVRRGEHVVLAAAEAGDGQRDDRDVSVLADEAGLGVSVEVPPTVAAGGRVPVTVVVTNTGRVPVRNAVAFVTAGAELGGDATPKELSVGTVPPGETRRVTVKLTAARAGRPGVWANVTADGDLGEKARGEMIVTEPEQGSGVTGQGSDKPAEPSDRPLRPEPERPAPPPPAKPKPPPGRPALVLEIVDPPATVTAGGSVRVRVKVRNRGTAAARSVEVWAAGEGGLAAAGGVGADRNRVSADAGRVQFATLPELRPGTAAVFEVELDGRAPGTGRLSAAVRAEHLTRPLKEEHGARVVEK